MSNATDKWYLSGALGIGTDNPEKMLHIQGSSTAPLLNDSHDRPGLAITGSYPELDLFSEANNPKHGPTIRLGSYNSDKKDSFKQWVIGTCGRDSTFLDIGFSDKNDPNPHAGIRNYNGQTCLTIHQDGNVGIGTTTPTARLEVMETFFPFPFVGGPILQPVLGTQSVLRDSKAEISLALTTGLRLFSQYNPKETRGGVINSCDADGTTRSLTLQLNRGNVGIGVTDTKRNLHVEGNEIHSGGPSGGFSFANRGTGFVEVPSNGERWVWYSHENKARLWSGTDKLSISKEGKLEINGELTSTGNVIIGKGGSASLSTRHIDGKHFQNDQPDGLFLNWSNGQPVQVGGDKESNLNVYGALTVSSTFQLGNGAVFNKFQTGTTPLGSNSDDQGSISFSISFPQPFSSIPKVIATARDIASIDHSDVFVVSTKGIHPNGFSINVRRLDNWPSNTWGLNLHLDWFAWT